MAQDQARPIMVELKHMEDKFKFTITLALQILILILKVLFMKQCIANY